jgi:hypothetical protein
MQKQEQNLYLHFLSMHVCVNIAPIFKFGHMMVTPAQNKMAALTLGRMAAPTPDKMAAPTLYKMAALIPDKMAAPIPDKMAAISPVPQHLIPPSCQTFQGIL